MSTTEFLAQAAQAAPRRRRSRPRPFNGGHLVSLVLAVLAGIAVLASLQGRAATRVVAITTRSVPAGALLTQADVRTVTMRATDAAAVTGLLSPRGVIGRFAAVPLVAGAPITQTETEAGGPAGAGLGQMSVSVPLADADGGDIVAGDRVDLVQANANGPSANGPSATYVAQGLLVLSVSSGPSPASPLGASSTASYFLVVAVGKLTALRVAGALADSGQNSLQVVRSTGEGPAASPAYVPRGSAGAGLASAAR